MMELVESAPSVEVRSREYRRLLGFPPRHEPAGRALELEAWAREWYALHGKPWYYLREVPLEVGVDPVRMGDADFACDELRRHLHGADTQRAVLLAASAGPECEEESRRLWEESQPDSYFFLETFGSAVVEYLLALAYGRICALAERDGLVAVRPYSPGYFGWDVSAQKRLFDLVTVGAGSALPGPLEVMASGMLRPKKSQLAVVGLAKRNRRGGVLAPFVPCVECSFSPCAYRRAPYRHAEDAGVGGRRDAPASPLNRNGRYRVNDRALDKWARERLRLQRGPDRSIVASFRYDGTTCSNMGWPIALDYRVRLGPPEHGLKVLQTECRAARDDTGFGRMCESISNHAGLLEAMAADCPLAGRPLDAVLEWDVPYDPAGCICSADSRLHKWRQVLEVIHFALARSILAEGPAGSDCQDGASQVHLRLS